MFKRIFFTLLALIFTLFIGVACSDQSEESNAKKDEADSAQAAEEESQTSNEESESPADEEQSNEKEADSEVGNDNGGSSKGQGGLPDTIEIYDKTQTENGVIFELETISFEDDHIAVDFNAENLSGYRKTFANQGAAKNDNLGGITLQDDTGFDYRYVAEREDARIQIEDQEKVDGTVRFLGRIEEDAKTLTLQFNPEEGESTTMPKFSYEDIEIKW